MAEVEASRLPQGRGGLLMRQSLAAQLRTHDMLIEGRVRTCDATIS